MDAAEQQYIYIHMYTHTHTHIHALTHTHTHTHTQTHTHTHTHAHTLETDSLPAHFEPLSHLARAYMNGHMHRFASIHGKSYLHGELLDSSRALDDVRVNAIQVLNVG